MEKSFIWVFVLLFIISFVSAVGWGDFNNESENTNATTENDSVGLGVNDTSDVVEFDTSSTLDSSRKSTSFTLEFYLALILFLLVVLIIVYLVYSFVRRRKNKWVDKKILTK